MIYHAPKCVHKEEDEHLHTIVVNVIVVPDKFKEDCVGCVNLLYSAFNAGK
jgi:hypothetical protein